MSENKMLKVGDKVKMLPLSGSMVSDLKYDYLCGLLDYDIDRSTYCEILQIIDKVQSGESPAFNVHQVSQEGYGLKYGTCNMGCLFLEEQLERIDDNIDKAIKRALTSSSLKDALATLAVWECERAVEQARNHQQWETCFGVTFAMLINKWVDKYSLTYEKLSQNIMNELNAQADNRGILNFNLGRLINKNDILDALHTVLDNQDFISMR